MTVSSTSQSPPVSPNLLVGEGLVPRILAPAGGRAQFFAALHSGADAVYLGMKEFNARSRAENFSFDDLAELVPLAHAHSMQVLVTINILLKEVELPRLIHDLTHLEWLDVDAVIVQDLGVARLIRQRFPGLRLHASTQLAIHNAHGVLQACALGFQRVVLARELTAQEMRAIHRAAPDVELEAFCHGSLCYSYSGLCFFSGAADARSGNRGECAYTCRKPYKILNEPGHGFLFSMKDLNTVQDLDKLVQAGIHTLKIEGRKKDAQFVTTAVGLYRKKLDELFGFPTAPHGRSLERDFQQDMAFSFHRQTTSLFVKGRYHENVIDLDNPTHKGLLIGKVEAVKGRWIEWRPSTKLERFDGLRIEPNSLVYHSQPQHGSQVTAELQQAQRRYTNQLCQFSVRDMTVNGRAVFECEPHTRIATLLPHDVRVPQIGEVIYKVRSNELKRFTDEVSHAPTDYRLRPSSHIHLTVSLASQNSESLMVICTAVKAQQQLARATFTLPAFAPQKTPTLVADLQDELAILGDAHLTATVTVEGDSEWFVPRRAVKQLKTSLQAELLQAKESWFLRKDREARMHIHHDRMDLSASATGQAKESWQIKCDRLSTIDAILEWVQQDGSVHIDEIIFEPKRAFLGQVQAAAQLASIAERLATHHIALRLAIPTVMRAWDEALIKPWIVAATQHGIPRFEIGNLGALPLLSRCGTDLSQADLSGDFTLYTLNTEAVIQACELGLHRVALSVEDDRANLQDKMQHWPQRAIEPQAILYKDTPLFIAEACSLTALHQGCPTAKVCGYRTLDIENDAGERFFVAHESCKSIVYGDQAYSVSQHVDELRAMGIQRFRLDFLTRPYDATAIHTIMQRATQGHTILQTHDANYRRALK